MPIALEGHDVDAELAADIQHLDGLSHPVRGNLDLEDGIPLIEGDVVEDVVGAVAHGRPVCHLRFGIDHLVCAVAQKELLLHVALGARDHELGTHVLQLRRGLDGALEIMGDCHDAHVIVAHAERGEQIRVGAVADLGVGDDGEDALDALLAPVYRHDLMAELVELLCNTASETAESYEQERFHGHSLSNGDFLVRQARTAPAHILGGRIDHREAAHAAKEHENH